MKIVTDNIVAKSPSLIIVGDTIKVNNYVEGTFSNHRGSFNATNQNKYHRNEEIDVFRQA